MFYLLLSMSLFLAPEDARLSVRAEPICACQIKSIEVQKHIDTMLSVAYSNTEEPTKPILVGLAAPQIGICKRIILVDLAATGIFPRDPSAPTSRIAVFINPEIAWQSEEQSYWREGCFSTGHVHGVVPRSHKILLRAYTRDGQLITKEFEGYTARIIQHEVDHLNGLRFPERIQNDTDLHWVEESEIPEYREHWANWPKKCPKTMWQALIAGTLGDIE